MTYKIYILVYAIVSGMNARAASVHSSIVDFATREDAEIASEVLSTGFKKDANLGWHVMKLYK